jgi:Response regulator of the LytR/AlgR family
VDKKPEESSKGYFCTAFDRFAVESYEVNAVDYLLKPISFERFEKAVLKAAEIINLERDKIVSNKDEFITVRSERKLYKIAVDEIIYIHSLSNYYKIVTPDKRIVVYGSLSALENKLPSSQFIRIHRSYLVAMKRIEAVSNTSVLISGKELPVGRKYKSSIETLYPQKND